MIFLYLCSSINNENGIKTMRIKALLAISLLFALWVGNTNAQDRENLPIRQNFENPDGILDGGWTFVNQKNPLYGEIISGIYRPNINEPTWTQCFHFWGGCRDYYSYLISPLLENVDNDIHFEFWFTNYFGTTPSNFRVGYSTFTNNPGDFEWGDLINATSGSRAYATDPMGWERFASDYPSDVKYVAIAFPNGQEASHLFVDDMLITSSSNAMPSMFQVTSITNESISLSWKGNSESYDIQHAPSQFFDFSDAVAFEANWRSVCDGESGTWKQSEEGNNNIEGRAGTPCIYSDLEGSNGHNYLVSRRVHMGGSISFYAKSHTDEGQLKKDGSKNDHFYNKQFKVMVYVGGELTELVENVLESQSKIIGGPYTSPDVWGKYTLSLDDYEGYQQGDEGYVIICHINDHPASKDNIYYYLLIDDFTLVEPYGEVVNNYEQTAYTMNGLVEQTCHALRVRANVGGEHSSWTVPLYVKTLPTNLEDMPDSYVFVNDGDWNVPSNWEQWYIPQSIGDNVTISANAVIPAGYVAKGTIGGVNGSITIKDGGQLMHHGTGVEVTMMKSIKGYENEYGNDHYYLLGFPSVSSLHPSNVTNMMPNNDEFNYDFYYFDQSADAEWVNHKDGEANLNDTNFWFFRGNGLLYARNEDATLSATFVLNPSSETYTIDSVPYVGGHPLSGWNLIANPFACNAHLSGNRPFYRLVETAEGSQIQLANEDIAIAPMEGIFVQVASEGENVTFTATESGRSKASMDFTLCKADLKSVATLDRNRVVFDEGHNMSRLDLMADSNRIYFPVDDKAMAVVYSQPMGELSLNLEVATDGVYALTFDCRADNLVYCHLIDNLTGADVNLLQQTEYTFEARVSDYPSRFRVLFAKANDNDVTMNDGFAYLFNGNLIVTNEGLAILQVIDVQGRIVKSETIEGNVYTNFSATPGVYVLRLINGENVKTQKMIVK